MGGSRQDSPYEGVREGAEPRRSGIHPGDWWGQRVLERGKS